LLRFSASTICFWIHYSLYESFSHFLSQICTSCLPVQESLSNAHTKALPSAIGSSTGSFSPAFYILLNFIPRCLSYTKYGGSRSLRNVDN
jgi:hypothetical protein